MIDPLMISLTRVLFVRHGRVASHRGDVALTVGGLEEAQTAGQRLLPLVAGYPRVDFLHAPTRRTEQTAAALQSGLRDAARTAGVALELGAVAASDGIRNPDLWIAGKRVEMVSSAEALAAQLPEGGPGVDELRRHPFMAGFWGRDDRLSFWMEHDDPPGETADETARRFVAYARSLAGAPGDGPRAVVCVTHSGPLRAVLRRYVLGEDPGEPDWLAVVTATIDERGGMAWAYAGATTPSQAAAPNTADSGARTSAP